MVSIGAFIKYYFFNAGGGGFFMFMIDPARRREVVAALIGLGCGVESFHFTNAGARSWQI